MYTQFGLLEDVSDADRMIAAMFAEDADSDAGEYVEPDPADRDWWFESDRDEAPSRWAGQDFDLDPPSEPWTSSAVPALMLV